MPASGSEARLRVFFMGTPELAVPTLAALAGHHEIVGVATQPDRGSGRGRAATQSPVKRWAAGHGLVAQQPLTLRAPEAVAAIAATDPDVVVVVAYGLILPAEVLATPRLGCINVHTSLLPRYRGASPIQAAILAGDPYTGVTTMLMDEGLDTGPILRQQQLVLNGDETAGTLAEALGTLGAALTITTLRELQRGNLEPRPQDGSRATSTRLIRKDDGRIDWQQPAVQLERVVRAMQPWPSAWTAWEGTRLQLWRVRPQPSEAHGLPGEVLRADERLVVACGDGALEVLELQRAGGKRLDSAAFLRGARLRVGERLGAGA